MGKNEFKGTKGFRRIDKMRRALALFMVTIVGLFPCFASADDAYEYLNMIMGIQYLDDVSIPTYLDLTDSIEESTGNTVCIISTEDGFIGINGRNHRNEYECHYYNNLTNEQMMLYGFAISISYDQIMEKKTAASDVIISLTFSEDSDPIIYDSAETAEQVAQILFSALKK